eukprot:gene22113-26243_t
MNSAPLEKVAVEHIATDQPPDDAVARDLDYGWQSGNQIELLENGEAYFPKVFEAMRQAQREILLETFILFEDKVGHELKGILIEAAQRGVKVVASLDGFGCGELTPGFLSELSQAGVTVQMFDPASKTLGFRTNWFRRLHRKIVVVDASVAFIGGINFSADHLGDFGPEAKQDYAVQVQGPAVADLHHFALAQSGRRVRKRRGWRREQRPSPWTAGEGDGLGQPDVLLAKLAARMLYDYLLKEGVVIHEYCQRPLHGKVALVDEEWSTVGSSNLDPLSLSLNLEANVLVRDRAFNQQLFERLEYLSQNHCKTMPENRAPRGWFWRVTVGFVVFHVLRHFPSWTGWLPAHKPRSVRIMTQARIAEESARPGFLKRWKKPLTVVFFLVLIVLFALLARRIDWSEVLDTLGDFKLRTLLIAGALTLCSFLVYSCFDLIGRTYIRQPLGWKQILPVGIISYAFNLNLSAWVGGIAMRYRLYSRLGVSSGNIAKILGLSLATNWFGYMAIAGAVFSSGLVTLPPGWKLSSGALQGVGVLLVLASLGYLLACRLSKKRAWSIRGIEISLPSLRMAVLQLALGALNWSLMAAVIFTLLPKQLDYPVVLGVLLISSIAGVVTHIPAGLGVLEAVFIALLQHEASRGSLLAGLIAYRAIYFILPLLVALVMYLAVEAKAKALRVKKTPTTG